MDREWQRQIHNDGPLQCSTLTLCLAIVAGRCPLRLWVSGQEQRISGLTLERYCATTLVALSTQHIVRLDARPLYSTAAFLIIIPPAGAAASYTKAQWGVEWALIQAESKDGKLPTLVSIGMFRVCYSSPRTACLAFQWGLEIGQCLDTSRLATQMEPQSSKARI